MNYSSDIKCGAANTLIAINSCGEQRPLADSHVRRYQGRQDYQLIYIEQGHCAVNLNGTIHIAHPGDCILYRPGQVQDYEYAAKDQPHAYWIHFTGQLCDQLFAECIPDDICIVKLSGNREIIHMITQICRHYNLQTKNYSIFCSGLLQCVLALIANHVTAASVSPCKNNTYKISELVSYMKMTSKLNLTIEECAAFCNLSKPHFSRVFKTVTGSSPVQFFLKLRIARAQELLDYTDRTMQEIAEASGFPDQNYFTRTFKKHTGMTPSQYRKNSIS